MYCNLNDVVLIFGRATHTIEFYSGMTGKICTTHLKSFESMCDFQTQSARLCDMNLSSEWQCVFCSTEKCCVSNSLHTASFVVSRIMGTILDTGKCTAVIIPGIPNDCYLSDREKKMIFCMKNSNQFDKLALKYFDRIHYSIDRDCVEHRITAQLHSWHSRPVKCQIESIDWHRDCWCYSPAATRLSRTRQRSGVSFEIYLWHKHQTSLPRLRIPNTNRHSIQS